MTEFRLRVAAAKDVARICGLIAASVRGLQGGDYSAAQQEGALATVFTVDSRLIEDGTYFVAEADGGELAGCGGWSFRKTLYGGDHQVEPTVPGRLDPAVDAAKIRAIFVRPKFARMGLGSLLLEAAERAAEVAGFQRFEMGSTLTGMALYRLKGYREKMRFRVPVGGGETIEVVRMVKEMQASARLDGGWGACSLLADGGFCAMVDMPMIAKGADELYLLAGMTNRHGLVAGATGTGKTVTLQVMAEALSAIGVPVFAADVKGDLSGISQAGKGSPKFDARVAALGLGEWTFAGCPVVFWDVFGTQGHPVRATVSEMGPLLLSRILNLNDTQAGVLTLVFKIADDGGLLLLDMKDLQAMLQHVGENAKEYQTQYGNISAASIGAIQRGLVALGQQGGDLFFGEPALNIEDLLQVDAQGRGVVNLLAADRLMQSPQLYATFLLWLMSELFEKLPEVGDPEKPKLVFFFDEAHLLFKDLPGVLQNRIEQVVRLIRSKGVGVYFVTQNPIDVPDTVLGQLGNRVQHALRAFSPRDQKAVKAAAQTFRANPKLNVEAVITEMGVGEALVSFLDEKGVPGMVERAMVCPPHSQIGPITPEQRAEMIKGSVLAGVYETAVDRESAYEKLKGKVAGSGAATPSAGAGWMGGIEAAGTALGGVLGSGSGRRGDTVMQAMVKSAARTMGSTVGRQLIRGVLGSLLGGSKR